jgi:hypothetical protein
MASLPSVLRPREDGVVTDTLEGFLGFLKFRRIVFEIAFSDSF